MGQDEREQRHRSAATPEREWYRANNIPMATDETRTELHHIHRDFVITDMDKTPNNSVIICNSLYINLCREYIHTCNEDGSVRYPEISDANPDVLLTATAKACMGLDIPIGPRGYRPPMTPNGTLKFNPDDPDAYLDSPPTSDAQSSSTTKHAADASSSATRMMVLQRHCQARTAASSPTSRPPSEASMATSSRK